MRRCAVVLASVLAATLLASHAGAYTRPGATARVNKVAGDQKDHGYYGDNRGLAATDVSADGRYVVFTSSDPELAIAAGYPGATLDAAGIFFVLTQVFRYDRVTRRVEVASLSTQGLPSLGVTTNPRISDSGRYVSFETAAPNLVVGDTNLTADVFVRDMKAETTERVSVSSSGAESRPGSGEELNPALSGDGRFVTFDSGASDLVPGDTNNAEDVFRHDRVTGKTRRVTVTARGEQANGSSVGSSVSKGGRFVAFITGARNLSGTSEGGVVRHDMKTGKNVLVSVANDGSTPPVLINPPSMPTISADGQLVAFIAGMPGFVPNDTNSLQTSWDVFLRDVPARRTTRVNVTSAGEQALGNTDFATISGNGRFIAFSSFADNLTAGDTTATCALCPVHRPPPNASGDEDVYVHDRITGVTERMTVTVSGGDPASCGQTGYMAVSPVPGISATGRYVSYWACYDGMVAGDAPNGEIYDTYVRDRGTPLAVHTFASAQAASGNELHAASLGYRPGEADVFGRIELRQMPTTLGIPTGRPTLYGLRFSIDGTAYEVRAQRALGADFDVELGAALGLFRKRPGADAFTKVATLRGGYGTTGAEIVFSIPAGLIDATPSTVVQGVQAFAAIGSYDVGAVQVLEALVLR